MPRGVTTLEQMVSDLRLETGRSSNTNFGQDEFASLKRLLQRTQRTLYYDYDWPFLKHRMDFTTVAGERYYDFDIDPERMFSVQIKYNGIWLPIRRGISMEDYTTRDSDLNQRQDPIEKWDVIHTGTTEQIEFWPMPATNGFSIRMEGIRPLNVFTSDNDVCTLDNDLIVLFAAAKLLAREKADDAKEALAEAQKLYHNIKRGLNRTEAYTPIGVGQQEKDKGVIVIAPGGA